MNRPMTIGDRVTITLPPDHHSTCGIKQPSLSRDKYDGITGTIMHAMFDNTLNETIYLVEPDDEYTTHHIWWYTGDLLRPI